MAFSLKAILGLETTQFERGLGKARNKLNSSVGGMMKSLAPLAGFLGFSTLASGALNLSREITNLSKVANTTGEDFQKRAFGAKTVRIEMEKLADIYKDTGDKIGDFLQTGGGPLADFFENIAPKIGVTADMFRDLSGPDALQLYYDSLDRANLSQNEMTFFMEAIASDATLLIPLLKNGGEAFEEFGKQAEEAGLIMSELERERLEKINLKTDVWTKKGKILAGTLLTKLIPAFQMLSQGLGFVSDIFGVAAANVVAMGTALGRVISAVIAPAISQIESLGFALKSAAQAASGDFEGAAKSIGKAKDAVKGTIEAVKDIPKEMKGAAADLKSSVESGLEVLGESIDKRGDQITDAFKDITGAANETEDAIADVIIAAKNASKEGDGTGGKGGDGKGNLIEMEQRLRKMKLEALKAEARGQDELAKKMKERIKLAEKILQIMKDTGATQAEAVVIANSQLSAESDADTSAKAPTKRSGRPSRFGKAPTFEERERAAGLFLAGNDPLSGRRGPESIGASSQMDGQSKADEISDPIVKAQKETVDEIKKLRTGSVT